MHMSKYDVAQPTLHAIIECTSESSYNSYHLSYKDHIIMCPIGIQITDTESVKVSCASATYCDNSQCNKQE